MVIGSRLTKGFWYWVCSQQTVLSLLQEWRKNGKPDYYHRGFKLIWDGSGGGKQLAQDYPSLYWRPETVLRMVTRSPGRLG